MKYVRMFLLLSIGSPVLYVGSYLLTVEAYLEKTATAGPRHLPHYHVGGKAAEQFYAPLHRLDTQIRTQYWHGL